MPMRGELAIRDASLDVGASTKRDLWPILGICLIGLAVSVYISASITPFNQIPLLIMQYNSF